MTAKKKTVLPPEDFSQGLAVEVVSRTDVPSRRRGRPNSGVYVKLLQKLRTLKAGQVCLVKVPTEVSDQTFAWRVRSGLRAAATSEGASDLVIRVSRTCDGKKLAVRVD